MGITTEALKEVIRFIFENTEIDRLNGRVDVRNIASNRVMEKCGFTYQCTEEKIFRQSLGEARDRHKYYLSEEQRKRNI